MDIEKLTSALSGHLSIRPDKRIEWDLFILPLLYALN
jgi:hypothetical protein